MLILITGPSCSGKTSFSRLWSDVDRIHLDRKPADLVCRLRQARQQEGPTIVEGLLDGGPGAIRTIVESVDCVIVLTDALSRRLVRAVRRDGLLGVPYFLYNEFCWRTYVRPVVFDRRYDALRRCVSWSGGDS